LYHLGEKARDLGENATQSKMVADEAWEIAEEVEVLLVPRDLFIDPVKSGHCFRD